jgi:hypothetical protein
LNFPLSAPQNEASIVKIFGTPISLNIKSLAVYSLHLLIENLDYSKEKKSHILDIIYGKTLVA